MYGLKLWSQPGDMFFFRSRRLRCSDFLETTVLIEWIGGILSSSSSDDSCWFRFFLYKEVRLLKCIYTSYLFIIRFEGCCWATQSFILAANGVTIKKLCAPIPSRSLHAISFLCVGKLLISNHLIPRISLRVWVSKSLFIKVTWFCTNRKLCSMGHRGQCINDWFGPIDLVQCNLFCW